MWAVLIACSLRQSRLWLKGMERKNCEPKWHSSMATSAASIRDATNSIILEIIQCRSHYSALWIWFLMLIFYARFLQATWVTERRENLRAITAGGPPSLCCLRSWSAALVAWAMILDSANTENVICQNEVYGITSGWPHQCKVPFPSFVEALSSNKRFCFLLCCISVANKMNCKYEIYFSSRDVCPWLLVNSWFEKNDAFWRIILQAV